MRASQWRIELTGGEMSILDLISKAFRKDTEIPFDDMKKRTRILVIDDKEFVYLKLFESDGYSMDKWNNIESLQKLEDNLYDIILLDQHGIGLEQSKIKGGMALLKHLKSHNPAQIVIAYSQSKFSLSDLDFFNMSDASLDKNSDYYVFKAKVDELIKKRFTNEYYADLIRKLLAAQGEQITEDEIAQAVKHIKKGKYNKAEKYIEGLRLTVSAAETCLGVVSIIKKVMAM